MSERVSTHWEGCWKHHPDCENELLRSESTWREKQLAAMVRHYKELSESQEEYMQREGI